MLLIIINPLGFRRALVFYEKPVLKNLAKRIGKDVRQSVFNKVVGLHPTTQKRVPSLIQFQ